MLNIETNDLSNGFLIFDLSKTSILWKLFKTNLLALKILTTNFFPTLKTCSSFAVSAPNLALADQ